MGEPEGSGILVEAMTAIPFFAVGSSDAIALDVPDSDQRVFYVRLCNREVGDDAILWLFVCSDSKFDLNVSTCGPMTRSELRETITEIYGGASIVSDPLGIFLPDEGEVPLDEEDDPDDEDFECEGLDDASDES